MGMRRLARIGMVVAVAAGSLAAATAQTATHTTLTAETREAGGHTVATFTIGVLDADGTPASGVVTLTEAGRGLSSAALDAEGGAQIKLDTLAPGDHALSAVYNGDAAHAASASESLVVHPQVSATPDFSQPVLNPTALTLKVGTAGTVSVTIAPINSFTGFISLSCAGPAGATTLPVGITCTFAPANLQIVAPTTTNPSGAVTAEMSIQTSTGHSLNQMPFPIHGTQNPVVLAVLLPGIAGLGFLGRKRKLFGRVALVLLIGGITLMGTTGCNPRYYYLNHGPTYPGATPGNYTIQVIAQTSNGITASAHSVNLALTVQQ
jgi:hypothetical protein